MNEVLPREWMRGPQWASPKGRREWEPVLRAAAAAWEQLEIESVSAGARLSALLFLTPAELVQAARDVAGRGLELTPLAWDGRSLRVALHVAELRGAWLEAWACSDDRAIGELLGFPACCREHFSSTWARGVSDTVLPGARSVCVDGPNGQREELDAGGPPEANVMHRHVGVRLVPHLPCSAACGPSVQLGLRFAGVGRNAGIDVEAILRVLSLPVEYSALHGVAITETPHWRVVSGTDWTAEERRARRAPATCHATTCQGEECGLPYAPTHHHDLTPHVQPPSQTLGDLPWNKGLNPLLWTPTAGQLEEPANWPPSWRDNGFSTPDAMEAAHAVVADAIGPRAGRVLDLGCGDGTLLARFHGPGCEGAGIELDPEVVARGRRRHPQLDLMRGRLETYCRGGEEKLREFDTVLLMPGRLLELSKEDAASVRRALRGAGRVVAYAYGDWLAKYGDGLPALCRAAGLEPVLDTWRRAPRGEGLGFRTAEAMEVVLA